MKGPPKRMERPRMIMGSKVSSPGAAGTMSGETVGRGGYAGYVCCFSFLLRVEINTRAVNDGIGVAEGSR